MAVHKDRPWRWGIVGAVTLLHLAVLGWTKYGLPRQAPHKSEITIELGVNQPPAGGAAAAAPAAAAPPPVPRPAERKPPPPRPVPEAQPAPSATPAPPAPATASPSPAPTTAQTSAPSAPSAATGPASPTGATGSGAAVAGTDQPVGYLNNPKPPYPRMAMLQGVEGTVRLQVLVQADGSASQVLLAQSSGSELLDKSALETVQRWKFTPARSQGKETAQWVTLPITFALTRR